MKEDGGKYNNYNMLLEALCQEAGGDTIAELWLYTVPRKEELIKALLAVVAEQIAVVEENLAQLYDDQFIETCAGWAIPYIGDLIGYRGLYDVQPETGAGGVNTTSDLLTVARRAEVANTIGFRRRKGTVAMLEELARSTTNWSAHVVEFFQLLATTEEILCFPSRWLYK